MSICKCADCKQWRKDEREALANHRRAFPRSRTKILKKKKAR
jgi:hypothetical protein